MGRKGDRNGENRKCAICSLIFYVPPSRIARGHGKYCSKTCYSKAQKVERKRCLTCGRKMKKTIGCHGGKYCSYRCFGMSIRNRVSRTCSFCGKRFEETPSNLIRKGRGRFCSKDCYDRFQRIGRKKWTCKFCGKVFSRRGKRIYKYCSWGCNHCAQQKRVGLNKLELAGKNILIQMRLDFKEQVLLFGKFTVDVFLEEIGLVIQWDGDYWHGNPCIFRNFNRIQILMKKRDKACNAYLKKRGLMVLRFWESDIKRRPEWITSEIKRIICVRDMRRASCVNMGA